MKQIEDSQNGLPQYQFDTKLKSLNLNWKGATPNGKEYHMGNVDIEGNSVTAVIPTTVATKFPTVVVGEEVTAVITMDQENDRNYITVIGLAGSAANYLTNNVMSDFIARAASSTSVVESEVEHVEEV